MQAARLQMVIMFMIAATTALASGSVCAGMVGVVVDEEGRVRGDRVWAKGGSKGVKGKGKGSGRKEGWGLGGVWGRMKGLFRRSSVRTRRGSEENGERQSLLGAGPSSGPGSTSTGYNSSTSRNPNPTASTVKKGDERV